VKIAPVATKHGATSTMAHRKHPAARACAEINEPARVISLARKKSRHLGDAGSISVLAMIT
jgi:hypothetical protein